MTTLWKLDAGGLADIEGRNCERCCPDVRVLAQAVRTCNAALEESRASVAFDRKHLADLAKALGMQDGAHAADIVSVAAYRLEKQLEYIRTMAHVGEGLIQPERAVLVARELLKLADLVDPPQGGA